MFKDIRRNIFLSFVVSSSILIAISSFFFPLTEDVALHFFHSIRMVEDGGLYTRWVEVMPPTIYLIYSIPVYLKKITGLGYLSCFNFFTVTLSFLSIYLTNASLKKHLVDADLRKNICAALIVIFFVLPTLTYSWNDRDALFLIFCFPWIINKVFKIENGVLVILLAAIGFSIKQYSYLYPALIILLGEDFKKGYFKKALCRENLKLAAAVVVLNLAYIAKFPEYYKELLPVLLISYKGVYTYPINIFLCSAFLFSVMIFLLFKQPAMRLYFRRYIILFFSALIVISLNGPVKYNYNHTESLILLAAFHLIYAYQNTQTSYTLKLLVSALLAFILASQLFILYIILNHPVDQKVVDCQKRVTAYTSKPYIYLSFNQWGFHQNYTNEDTYYFENKNHIFAIDHLWMLPWLYNNLENPKAEIVKNYIRKKMIEALHREKNVTIMVVTSKLHEALPEELDLMDFMRKDLNLSDELKGFRSVDLIQNCTAAAGDTIQVWQKQ